MRTRPKRYHSIIQAGLLAGTLDIAAAIISTYLRSGKMPGAIFRYIASGAFGKAAFTGGVEVIVAGILFHYLIAFAFTIAFFLVYPKLEKWLAYNIAVSGLLYGLVAWCIMNLLVLPISKVPPLQPTTSQVILGMLYLMFLVGLPVAFMARKYYRALS